MGWGLCDAGVRGCGWQLGQGNGICCFTEVEGEGAKQGRVQLLFLSEIWIYVWGVFFGFLVFLPC